MQLLQIQSLRKIYVTRSLFRRQDTEALRGIDIEIPENETTVILGKNGAGKTTFMNICAGLLNPSAGKVMIKGHDPVAYRDHIGYLPESISLPEFLTVIDFLTIMGSLSAVPQDLLKTRIDGLLKTFDLTQEQRKPIRNLSMGNKRKVLIAQSLVHRPEILILDEPTVYLDFIGKETFYKVLQNVKNDGCTIIMSSHVLTDIERLGDRILVLNQGRITRIISQKELKEQQNPEQFIVALLEHYEHN